jgi:phosphoglycolate phosphatase
LAPFLIVFDVDGTLVDSQAHIIGAMGHAFSVLRRPMPPRQDVLACVGLSLPEVFYRLVPQVDHEQRDLAEKAFKQYFAGQRADQSDPGFYAGILPLLRQLHQDPQFILGVATGNSRRGLNALLEASELHSYLLTTQTADEHPSKPHPSMLHQALLETGTEASRAVMIGDTSYDRDMACAAGMHAIGVTWGYHKAHQLSGCTHIAQTVSELPGFISQIMKA